MEQAVDRIVVEEKGTDGVTSMEGILSEESRYQMMYDLQKHLTSLCVAALGLVAALSGAKFFEKSGQLWIIASAIFFVIATLVSFLGMTHLVLTKQTVSLSSNKEPIMYMIIPWSIFLFGMLFFIFGFTR